jgi:hypothetical protein
MAEQFKALQSKLLTVSLNKPQKKKKYIYIYIYIKYVFTILYSKQNHLKDGHTGENMIILGIHF